MRRRPGIGGVQASAAFRARAQQRGHAANADLQRRMEAQLATFRRNLEDFARHHGKDIQRSPEFRAKFHRMCAAVGVDPLTSRKGVWAEMLGVGDFYYELAVRTVEVCVSTRGINGGILEMSELLRRLRGRRITFTEKISVDDVERAVKKLKTLGGGFAVVALGQKKVIRSVPLELSVDHTKVLQLCEDTGYTTLTELVKLSGWTRDRAMNALKFLMKNEMAWIDDQGGGERSYWFLGLVKGTSDQQ